ncbi:MAG: glycosyltransferase family 39 protein [Fimbriimonadaceae bacterium]|nr:glycosyltransferase family 39 protein [Fimbriimonadaceae bacterium]
MNRRTRLGVAAGLVVVVGLGASQLFAEVFGLTYDEPVYAGVAERHWEWFERLLHGDASALSRAGLERHWGNSGDTPLEADWQPPVGKLVGALGRRLPLPGVFARYRAGNVLLYALTAALLWLWIGGRAGPLAGAAAAGTWLVLPGAVHHGSLAGIDQPVACFATLALWCGQRAVERPTWRRLLLFSLTLTLAVESKFNGVLVAPAVLLAAAWQRPGLSRREWGRLLLATGPVAFLLGLALWPWLWYDTFRHLGQVIQFHGRHGYIATLYLGRVWIDPPPPWHYAPVLLAITTPLPLLAAAGLGAATARRDPLARLLLVAVLCHLAPFLSPAAAKYNGVRLFVAVLPLLAALAGLGAARLLTALLRRWPAWAARRRALGAALLAAGLVPALAAVLSVYPYPSAWANALVGGPAGAVARGCEPVFWGEPLRECLVAVSRAAAPGEVVYLNPPGALAMCGIYQQLNLVRPELLLGHGPQCAATARWFVYQNRRSEWDAVGQWLLDNVPPRYVARAGEVPVGYVWERPSDGGGPLWSKLPR